MKFMITGGAGFIGSAVIRHLLSKEDHQVLNFDKLTYAGNLESLANHATNVNYRFVQGDICDYHAVLYQLKDFQPDVIMNFAAESHVDRSIDGPSSFIETNIVGTAVLLEAISLYWKNLSQNKKRGFRFHHISTDEVYGSLGRDGLFTERTAYDPSSPYSASKASSDHLVRAWSRTYDLPVLITNCSNNYGPYQFPEKLIPVVILNALDGRPLPIYGDGKHIRDWLYVEDHARALYKVVTQGEISHTYNIGGHNEKSNLDVVCALCDLLDELASYNLKAQDIGSHKDLIAHVADRPGHDQRYAIDASKIKRDIGWVPQETFESGLRKTVRWYLDNLDWCAHVVDRGYQVGQRLGVIE